MTLLRWTLVVTGALTTSVVLGGLLHAKASSNALLRMEPDAIPSRPDLVRYAASVAKPIYARDCAGCHGADMAGRRDLGGPNLKDGDWLYGEGRVSDIEQTILYGVRSGSPKARNLAVMPAFGRAKPSPNYKIAPLTPGQIRDVAEHVVLIEGRPADPVAAARGADIFANGGGCYDCHGVDGLGDPSIGAPNLVDRVWLYGSGSRANIERSIAEGRQGVCPAWIGRLSLASIRALAVYIHIRSAAAHPGSF